MEMIEKYNEALNNNINTLSKLLNQKDKLKIKRFILEEVDKYNMLPSDKLYKEAYLLSCKMIKVELI